MGSICIPKNLKIAWDSVAEFGNMEARLQNRFIVVHLLCSECMTTSEGHTTMSQMPPRLLMEHIPHSSQPGLATRGPQLQVPSS